MELFADKPPVPTAETITLKVLTPGFAKTCEIEPLGAISLSFPSPKA
jgi:hypothetical protein